MSVGVVRSGSVAVILKFRLEFSLTLFGPIAARTGGRLTSLTVIATSSESVRVPSEVMNRTLNTPACVKLGLKLNDPVPLPLSVKLAFTGTFSATKVGVEPSGSIAFTPKLSTAFSLTFFGPIVAKTGARFVLVTVIATSSLSASVPSDVMNVTLTTPLCEKSGVKLNVAVPLPLSVSVAFGGVPTAENVGVVASGSVALNPKFRLAPSATDFGPIAASTGARLTLFTVMATTSLSASVPSDAIKVTL